jgi:ABC-type antimicrobial peptide transport system permease subunit
MFLSRNSADCKHKIGPAAALVFQHFLSFGSEPIVAASALSLPLDPLSGVYGALATVLAMVGIYGIISFMVIRRSGEMGLRIALGAQRTRVVGIVLREAAALVAGGLVVGTAVAIACARTVRTL